MADEKYFQAFKKGSKEFEVVGAFWELMKMCDTPELKKMCSMLFDAFDRYEGKAEDVKEIWLYWWVLFQSYYKNDGSEEYWQELCESVIAFNEKYRGTNETYLVLGLATMVSDFNQWRQYEM